MVLLFKEKIHHNCKVEFFQAIDAKHLTGDYDSGLYLKAQVDNLTGRNDELRKELRESRIEATQANIQLEKLSNKVTL